MGVWVIKRKFIRVLGGMVGSWGMVGWAFGYGGLRVWSLDFRTVSKRLKEG